MFVLDPLDGGYLEVPTRDLSRPGISLWEHRLARRRLRAKHRGEIDEAALFAAVEEMRAAERDAARLTRSARRDRTRRTTAPDLPAAPPSAEPKPPLMTAEPAATDDGETELPRPFDDLLVQMPPSPTVGRLYAAVLAGLGMPGAIGSRSPDREAMAMRLLHQVGCRMLLLDELHNLLAAPGARQRELLNLLRYLGNELRIPIACFGTREAYLAIRSDDQLENRFEPFLLPAWEDGPEFGRLLASFEAVLPLCEPSGLGAPALRAHVLRRSEGTIGEVAALLAAAMEAALLAGEERIGRTALDTAAYHPPTVRRRLFERELR